MKQILYIWIIGAALTLFATKHSHAQSTYYHFKYSYDDSGNREKRIYIGTETKSATIGNSMVRNEKEPLEETLGSNSIKIYPNPTKGMLKIEIPDLQDNSARLMVFNNRGQLIKEIKVNSNLSTINLSSHPSGMYILKILIGQNSSEWKIIKD